MGKHLNTGVPNNHNNRMEKQTQVYQTITIIEWGNKFVETGNQNAVSRG
jgi:hypothetical protein